MNKDRMLKWAAMLERVPNRSFDMKFYARSKTVMKDKPVCSTAACALGWATAVPEFHRAGLELRAVKGDREANVMYRGMYAEDAAAAFFDISYEQAREICISGFSMTAKEKAARIREMVAEEAVTTL